MKITSSFKVNLNDKPKKKETECGGFSNLTRFELLLDTNKHHYVNGCGDMIGVISNNSCHSTTCITKCYGNKSVCNQCASLERKLIEDADKLQKFLNNPETLPPFSSIISYPRVMYQLLTDTTNEIKNHPQDNHEKKFLELYRKAKDVHNTQSTLESKIIKLPDQPKIPKTSRFTHIPAAASNPLAETSLKQFEDCFFMKFLENQLSNYAKHPNHHRYDEVQKRFWLLSRYFSGKQFFQQMSGKKNQNIPTNWRTNLQYNLIMPNNNTLKKWLPKGSMGFCKFADFVFTSLVGESCKDVCITIDGMKVFKQLDYMNGTIVGTSQTMDVKNLPSNNNVKLNSLTEEMLYFNVCSIDNSWYCPLAWFPICSSDKVNDVIHEKLLECNDLLKKYNLNLACACADGEIDARNLQLTLRPKIGEHFVFVNDYVHNFKNQRNCLFSTSILGNIN